MVDVNEWKSWWEWRFERVRMNERVSVKGYLGGMECMRGLDDEWLIWINRYMMNEYDEDWVVGMCMENGSVEWWSI